MDGGCGQKFEVLRVPGRETRGKEGNRLDIWKIKTRWVVRCPRLFDQRIPVASISTIHSLSGEVREARRQPRYILTNNPRLPSSFFSACRSSRSSWDASTMVPTALSYPTYQARGGFDNSHKTEDNVIEERDDEVTREEEPSVK